MVKVPSFSKFNITELPAKNGENAKKKTGDQKVATGGLGAKPPAVGGKGVLGQSPRKCWGSENFYIFSLKKAIFSAFNCIICCNNVLRTMHCANTKCSDV